MNKKQYMQKQTYKVYINDPSNVEAYWGQPSKDKQEYFDKIGVKCFLPFYNTEKEPKRFTQYSVIFTTP